MAKSTVLNTIPELLDDLRDGRMIVLMDDEERENEGDLIMAASKVRPEDINFMARYGRGLICLPLTRERCAQLNLPLMVNRNQAHFATNFTVSIEAAEGITTGISAYDRAHTIRTAVRPDATPDDLTQPGHVFPLMCNPGGVLARAGHTEASVDLADDRPLLEEMVDAGFSSVFVGIETPSRRALEQSNKLQNLRGDLTDAVRTIHAAGLEVMGGFIVGFDSDEPDIFQRQFEFIQQTGVVTAMVGLLQALPNSRLYRRLAGEGRLRSVSAGDNTRASFNFEPRLDREFLLEKVAAQPVW